MSVYRGTAGSNPLPPSGESMRSGRDQRPRGRFNANARLTRNRETRKTIRLSTATGPTSRSAAAPTRYSSATSPWRAKRQQMTIELPPRISISTRSTIFALITRAVKAISRGRHRRRPRRPTSRRTRRQIREKLTWIASNPNAPARIPFPRKPQLSEPNLSQRTAKAGPRGDRRTRLNQQYLVGYGNDVRRAERL